MYVAFSPGDFFVVFFIFLNLFFNNEWPMVFWDKPASGENVCVRMCGFCGVEFAVAEETDGGGGGGGGVMFKVCSILIWALQGLYRMTACHGHCGAHADCSLGCDSHVSNL